MFDEDRRGPESAMDRLSSLAGLIDWQSHGRSLGQGKLDGVPSWLAADVEETASRAEIMETAATLGLAPIRLVIALVAHAAATESRHAARVLRRLLRGVDRTAFERCAAEIDRQWA